MNLQTSKNSQKESKNPKTYDLSKSNSDNAIIKMSLFKTLINIATVHINNMTFKQLQYDLIENLNLDEDVKSLIETCDSFVEIQRIISLTKEDFEKYLVVEKEPSIEEEKSEPDFRDEEHYATKLS